MTLFLPPSRRCFPRNLASPFLAEFSSTGRSALESAELAQCDGCRVLAVRGLLRLGRRFAGRLVHDGLGKLVHVTRILT